VGGQRHASGVLPPGKTEGNSSVKCGQRLSLYWLRTSEFANAGGYFKVLANSRASLQILHPQLTLCTSIKGESLYNGY